MYGSVFYEMSLFLIIIVLHTDTHTYVDSPKYKKNNIMPIRITLKKKNNYVIHLKFEYFVVQIIEKEKEMFLAHVYCGALFKKNSSLSKRPEKCDLQWPHYNWIEASKKLDLVDIITFEFFFFN